MWGVNLSMLLSAIVVHVYSAKLGTDNFFDVNRDVQIDLYSLANSSVPQVLIVNNSNTITSSNFNGKIPTRIIIHGFYSKGQIRNTLIDAYFTKGKKIVNLIYINWEIFSQTINYIAAVRQVQKIGIHIAQFIDFMVTNKYMKLADVHLIGFSLGSHIAGIAGKSVRSGRIPLIIGLDAASLLFSLDKPDERLDSQDAEHVVTIHTSKLGFFDPLGTVSFYPNGGRIQPECSWDITGKCSHRAAYQYFARTIYSEQPIVGYLCHSLKDIKKRKCLESGPTAVMGGEPTMSQPAGTYYVTIDNEAVSQ